MKNLVFLLALFFFSEYSIAQPTAFQPRGIGGGGALFFPTINPTNDNEFYVSCDMSEMFHSTDFGNSYDQVDFTKLQVFNTSTYEFTNNPTVGYSNFNDGNQGYPVKTTNGGNTWNRMLAYDLNMYGKVYKISANYSNPDQLLVGAYGDILFSSDGGASFSAIRHATNMGAGLIMGGVFWDGADIYIGTNEGILHSANSGGSFTMMNTTGMNAGQVIWNFAGSRTGSDIRFVCIASDNSGTYNGLMPWEYNNFAKGVYIMDNANGTWIPKSTGINFLNDFIMYVAMAWNDINTIYLGGSDQTLNAPLVMKSDDGGNSWIKKFNTTNNANIVTAWEGYQGDKSWSWSETCFGITVAPLNKQKVIFTTYSNVQVSSDGGDNWKQAYVQTTDQHPAGSPTPKKMYYHSIGLENTTCWQVHWQNASTLIGCFSDIGGIRSTNGGDSWGYDYSGFSVNSLYRIASSPGGILYGVCSNIHDMYQSTRLSDALLDGNDVNGKIVFSSDDGLTWNTLHTFNHPVFWMAIDPNDTNTMYASVIHYGGTPGAQIGGIYVTHNLGSGASSTWSKLPDPPRTEGHPANVIVLNDGKVLCTFSGRRNQSGAFTSSSGVFIYNPLSNAWTDLSDPGMYYWTKDIVIDPQDSLQNTWYVCVFSGWGGAPNGLGGLYKTTNRGQNWTKLTGSQFDRVTSITFDPVSPSNAYLTTETQGLWYSTTMNLAIPQWALVAAYPFRQPERVFFNPYNSNEVWVTSFGNGMKTGNLVSTGIESKKDNDHLYVFPNPANGQISIYSNSNVKDCLITVRNSLGQLIFKTNENYPLTTIETNAWPKGIYFVHRKNSVQKLIVN